MCTFFDNSFFNSLILFLEKLCFDEILFDGGVLWVIQFSYLSDNLLLFPVVLFVPSLSIL